MQFKDTVGIDVSKATLDAFIYGSKIHSEFTNNPKGFKRLVEWIRKRSDYSINQILICFEHTGVYSLPMAIYLGNHDFSFCMESALRIKRSIGITRGKNDKIDARRIAEYAFERRHKLKTTQMPSAKLLKINRLLSLRERLVKQRTGFKSFLKECKAMLNRSENKVLFRTQEQMISYLDKKIGLTEKTIRELLYSDAGLKKVYDLITSVKGVGFVLATSLIVTTNCFASFDNPRKYACYSGVAPFKYQSGTSLNSRSRVNHKANKKIKALLNLAASSAIQFDPEIKAYYERRIKIGKSKMSTLNVIRNKIIYRVFAVIRRQTPYVVLNRNVT